MKACHMVTKLRHVMGSEDEGITWDQKMKIWQGVRR